MQYPVKIFFSYIFLFGIKLNLSLDTKICKKDAPKFHIFQHSGAVVIAQVIALDLYYKMFVQTTHLPCWVEYLSKSPCSSCCSSPRWKKWVPAWEDKTSPFVRKQYHWPLPPPFPHTQNKILRTGHFWSKHFGKRDGQSGCDNWTLVWILPLGEGRGQALEIQGSYHLCIRTYACIFPVGEQTLNTHFLFCFVLFWFFFFMFFLHLFIMFKPLWPKKHPPPHLHVLQS